MTSCSCPPLHPEKGLGKYICEGGRTSYYFCKTCGVRCFSFRGKGEVAEVHTEGWGSQESKDEKTVQVWRPKKEGWKEGEGSYLSLNALTFEPGQEGFDLREWREKNWIWYLDKLHKKGDARLGEPHEGGCF
jgi:hypothetical protein